MKVFKKLAMVVAVALAVTTIIPSTKAEAAIKSTVNEKYMYWDSTYSFWSCPTKNFFENCDEIYGVQYYMKVYDTSGGFGGGVVINGQTNSWDQREWGNEGAGKAYVAEATGEDDEYCLTFINDAPCFPATDNWANFVISQWWGADITVTRICLVDERGFVLFDSEDADNYVPDFIEEEPVVTAEPAVKDATAKTADSFSFTALGIMALVCVGGFFSMKMLKKDEN